MLKTILFSVQCFFLFNFGFCQTNNLVHLKGYQTSEYGTLGKIIKIGNGPKDMIMIAGWGFDEDIFENFMADSTQEKYTMYVVTLPGFGDTQAYPMPDQNEVYQDMYWTKGIISGLKNLIEDKGLAEPVILSYFTYSNILALRMALDYPDLIDRVIIVSGMAKFTTMNPSYEPASLAERIYYTEKVIAQDWFKEMDKKGWDDGNFSPDTFSKDSIISNKYWEQMSNVPIPTMVRYLLEYYCTDLSLEYDKLSVPTLVVMPSFTREALMKPGNYYLTNFFHDSWWGANPSNPNFHLMTIMDSHAFILNDQPKKLIDVVNLFTEGKLGSYDIQR